MELNPPISPDELAVVDANRLPTQAKVIVQLIGIEDAWALMSQYGGRSIQIPVGMRSDTYLHRTVSFMSAEALIGHWAGERLILPKNNKISQQIRDYRIFNSRKQGMTVPKLARLFDLSSRSIILICQRMSGSTFSQIK
ncbi:hypothetical protein KFZ76_13715 [Methylovulum psychrotolerans]|uniref:Mor transcription activator family protein n=1 Tax=Methylovulum psychrotolerans TaxID=1704499 RepID=UPI001BFF8277|nr:Mor transcription activator family protein [Methylovulum psychrotolerans]MBT9098762.1 hypothetical protein [Methylovulum psychrotolerans]